ncbi:MAG TPA: right-handed parallel beta-helix repeat-containing protein [Methylophilaceae bacterium]|jgi:hypothetical protein
MLFFRHGIARLFVAVLLLLTLAPGSAFAATSAYPPISSSQASALSLDIIGKLASILQSFSSFLSQQHSSTAPPEQVAAGGNPVAYNFPPASQRIDNLTNATINNPSITGGSISGGSISGATVAGYLPLGGGTLTGTLSGTDLTLSGALTAGTLNVVSIASAGALTGPYFTATSTTQASTFNFASTTALSVSGTGYFGTATTTNLFASAATSTSLFATLGHLATGIIDSLSAAVATITNLTTTNFTATSATTTNATSTNLFATNLAAVNLTVTGSTTITDLITKGPIIDIRAYGAKCDGVTDDQVAIQGALNAAPSTGGTVIIPAGMTCGVGAAGLLLSNKSDVVFRAGGDNAGLKALAVSSQLFATLGSTMVVLDNCTRCKVVGLHIDGNAIASNMIGVKNSTEAVVSDNHITGNGGNGAIVSAANSRNSYSRNVISDTVGSFTLGMWIGNTNTSELESDPLIDSNFVASTSGTGIAASGSGAIITNNNLIGSGGPGSGITVNSNSGNNYRSGVISNNVVRGWGFHGIQSDAYPTTYPNGGYTEGVTVTNNIVEQNAGSGIFAVRVRNWAITGNICRDNNYDGVSTGEGIEIGLAQDVTVSGNNCYDSRSGLSRTQTAGITLVAQTGALESQDVLISDNMVKNNVNDGITVTTSGSGTMDGVTLSNNVSIGNGGRGISMLPTAGTITNMRLSLNRALNNASVNFRIDDPVNALSWNGDATDRVAIGTTTSYSKLTVWGSDTSALTSALLVTNNASTTLLNIANNGLLTFTNASTTNITASYASTTNLFAQTATIGTLNLTNGISVASGGTGTTTQVTNGVNFFDGTKVTSGTALMFNGSNLGIGSTNPTTPLYIRTASPVISLFNTGSSDLMTISGGINGDGYLHLSGGGSRGVKLDYNAGTTGLSLVNGGNIGIGTTTPWARLSVAGAAGGTAPLFTISSSTSGFATSTAFTVDQNGLVGIGTSSPTAQLSTTGTVRFSNFGAGTLQTDANGNLSVSSDERLKNIQGTFTRGLADIVKLSPILYQWKPETGYDASTTYAGFSAQNVQAAIPEAVGQDSKGFLTLQDRPLIAALVNAEKEIATISGSFKNALIAWLGDSTNGIGDFFAAHIHATDASVGTLCITKSDGTPVCVTGDQLAAVLATAGQQPAAATSPSNATSSISIASSTPILLAPPVIQINGNNPATVSLGTAYADLGATITGPQQDLNLGITTFLNGVRIDAIQLDTSTTSTSTIDYVVTDQFGTTATATRTVIPQPAAGI